MWNIDGKLLFFQYGCIFTEFNRIFMKATLIFPLVNLEKAVASVASATQYVIYVMYSYVMYSPAYGMINVTILGILGEEIR